MAPPMPVDAPEEPAAPELPPRPAVLSAPAPPVGTVPPAPVPPTAGDAPAMPLPLLPAKAGMPAASFAGSELLEPQAASPNATSSAAHEERNTSIIEAPMETRTLAHLATIGGRLTSSGASSSLTAMARTRGNGIRNASLIAFTKAADLYVEETFRRFPSYGSSTGRHEFDAELERPTLALYRAHEKLLRTTLTTIEDLPELDFTGNDWLDRRALLAELRTELWAIERNEFRKNPERWAGGAIGSVHYLVVKYADDLKPAANAILSRLQKLPAYLASGAALLEAPVPVWTN